MSELDDIFGEDIDSEFTPEEIKEITDRHSRIHRVFAQSEEGKKLLEEWADEYLMNPIVVPGMPVEAHGINEGKASFVRHIIKTIKLVESNYNQ